MLAQTMTSDATLRARALLDAGVAELLGAPLPSLTEELWRYVTLLQRWNRTYNLTAVRDPEAIVTHHLLDSLTLWRFVATASAVLDVGTGPGLPAVPLALAAEALQAPLGEVVALDAVKKKIAFVQQCVIELGVRRLSPVAARLPAWHPERPFPVIVSRAFASLADFVRLTEPLLAPGGRWVAMKGKKDATEYADLPAEVKVVDVVSVTVPFLSADRHLVIVERRQ